MILSEFFNELQGMKDKVLHVYIKYILMGNTGLCKSYYQIIPRSNTKG